MQQILHVPIRAHARTHMHAHTKHVHTYTQCECALTHVYTHTRAPPYRQLAPGKGRTMVPVPLVFARALCTAIYPCTDHLFSTVPVCNQPSQTLHSLHWLPTPTPPPDPRCLGALRYTWPTEELSKHVPRPWSIGSHPAPGGQSGAHDPLSTHPHQCTVAGQTACNEGDPPFQMEAAQLLPGRTLPRASTREGREGTCSGSTKRALLYGGKDGPGRARVCKPCRIKQTLAHAQGGARRPLSSPPPYHARAPPPCSAAPASSGCCCPSHRTPSRASQAPCPVRLQAGLPQDCHSLCSGQAAAGPPCALLAWQPPPPCPATCCPAWPAPASPQPQGCARAAPLRAL